METQKEYTCSQGHQVMGELHAVSMIEIGNQCKRTSVENLIAPLCVCVCVFLGVGCKDEGDQEELPSRANGVY